MDKFKNLDRREFIGAGAAALGAMAAVPWAGRIGEAAPQDKRFQEMTPNARKAIEKGLDWLRKVQHKKKGHFGCEKGAQASAAITGLAGLAFLATGSTPSNGKYQEIIQKAVDWGLNIQRGTGVISKGYDVTGIGIFFEHASMSMFLTEAYGMNHRAPENDRIRKGVQKAINYLDKQQNRDGGWSSNTAGGASDLALTAAVYSSLRSAHNSGLDVDDASVSRLVAFAEKRAIKSGGYRGTHGMFYPTSAGLRIMWSQARQNEPHVVKSTRKVLRHKIASEYGGSISEWDYLAAFYTTQAFLLDSTSDAWKKWFPKIRDYLIKKQNPDGSWTVEYCMVCRAFATALSLLILQAPLRTLPLWQL